MKVILTFANQGINDTSTQIIKEWFEDLQKDTDREHPTPVRFATNIEVTE